MFDLIKNSPLLWIIIVLMFVAPGFLFGAIGVVMLIILAIFVAGVIMLSIFKWKLRKFAQQQGGQGAQGAHGGQYQQTKTGDPDVKIYTTQSEKKVSSEVGDYVDFEEVKEE